MGHYDLDVDVVFLEDGLVHFLLVVFFLEVEAEILVPHSDLHAMENFVRVINPSVLLSDEITSNPDRTKVELEALAQLIEIGNDD